MNSAYSYIRFSSAAQEKGDSLRRQTDAAAEWCKVNGVHLDSSLTLHDLGKSAFTGKHRENPDRNALAAFLKLVGEGKVPRGSYLIVESMDRLTREDVIPAVHLVTGLLLDGIRIVQLKPSTKVFDDKAEMHDVMMLVVELMRGNSESAMKSDRVGKAKKKAKQAARETGKPMGKQSPAWLELVDGKYLLKEDAAKTVRLIYRLCAEGMGILAITRKLNTEGVPPIARTTRSDGQPMKRPGTKWITSYVAKILDSRATIGEYQPMNSPKNKARTPDGEPIPNYYPPVVTETEFHAALKARQARHRRSGRPAKGTPHLFTGLLWCARDGCRIYFATRSKRKYLISARSVNGETGIVSFPMKEFHDAVLSQLRELPASDLFSDPGAEDVVRLEAQLAEAERKLADAGKNWEENQDSEFWAGKATIFERKCKTLRQELEEARQRVANPTSTAWAEIRETDPGRLRAVLLRTIDRIYCVTAARSEGRLLACQVHFKDSDKRRCYLIHYIQGKGGFAPREASYKCWSLDYVPGAGKLDLTRSADVAALQRVLSSVDVDTIFSPLS